MQLPNFVHEIKYFLMSRLKGIVQGKCPVCEQGSVFKESGLLSFKMPEMHEKCEHCGHAFEKENGYFWGAMFVSYALIIAEIICTILVCQLFFTEKMDTAMIWIVVVSVLLLSRFNYRMARIVWMYIFTQKRTLA